MISAEFLAQFEHLVNALTSDHLGVIVNGESLCGKSTLLSLAARFVESKESPIRIKRVYHHAYLPEQVYGFGKTPSILSQLFDELDHPTWIVLDGELS